MSNNLLVSISFYQQNNERLQKNAGERYQCLTKEEKKHQYGWVQFKNLSEHESKGWLSEKSNMNFAKVTCNSFLNHF